VVGARGRGLPLAAFFVAVVALHAQLALAGTITGATSYLLVRGDASAFDALTGDVVRPVGAATSAPGRLLGDVGLHARSTALGGGATDGVLVVPVTWPVASAGTFGVWFKLDRQLLPSGCDIPSGCANQPDNWIFRYDVEAPLRGNAQLRYWRDGVLYAGFELDGQDLRVRFDPRSPAAHAALPGFRSTEWHFYALTWASGQPVTLYIDGVAVGATRGTLPALTGGARSFSVGGWPGAYAANGVLSQAQSYSVALAAAAIRTLADPTQSVTPFTGARGELLCLERAASSENYEYVPCEVRR
jgi:hypothetical protein